MITKDEDMIAAEADARLDEFFAEDEWQADAGEGGGDAAEELGIKELKALILSLDWEITDEIMIKLHGEVDKLRSRWESDSVVKTFLSLLDNLGRYIAKKKAEAHPDSVGLLQNAYQNLEKVLSMSGMDEESRKQIVKADVLAFKKLREEIQAGKSAEAPGAPDLAPAESPPSPPPAAQAAPAPQAAAPSLDIGPIEIVLEKIVEAVHGLKDVLQTEARALRTELEALKNEMQQSAGPPSGGEE